MVSQTKQVCYILLDSVFILADRCLRTLELKLSVFSWFQVFRFQVVLTKDVFPHLSATLSVTCSMTSYRFTG